MKDQRTYAARTRNHLRGAIRGRRLAADARRPGRPARHPAWLTSIAVAVIASLALALTALPQAPAQAAARHPQSQQPVIQYLPQPVLVSISQIEAQTTATSFPIVTICLSNAHTHCLGTEKASARRADDGGVVDTIVSAVVGGVTSGLVQIAWKMIFGKGSTTDRGDATAEDVGGDGTQPPAMRDTCLGANPTSSDGNDRVYPSSPSKCFGVLRQSWLYTIEPGTKANYDLISRAGEAEHRVFALAQLNLRDGAFLYVKPNVEPGLWTTWSFVKIGDCVANCG